jgi:thymidine kinase
MMIGRIELIIGPMGGGKSTELLRRIERYAIGKNRVALVKPLLDSRSGDNIRTHDSRTAKALPFKQLCQAVNDVSVVDAYAVGVDEGQFFPDLVEGCEALAHRGKVVIVAALSGDSDRIGFPSVINLIPRCESVTMLNAVCMHCGDDAPFTAHAGRKDDKIKVGDIGEYLPLCRECYERFVSHSC